MSSKKNVAELIELYKNIEGAKLDKERVYIKNKLSSKMNYVLLKIGDLKRITNSTSKSNHVINVLEKKCNQTISNINELEYPFLLSVVGPGKYGKSTLINALLESTQAKVDDLPKTWKIDIFYGSDNCNLVKVMKKDGSYLEKSRQEVNELLSLEENKVKESEKFIREEIKRLKTTIKDKQELRDIKSKLEKDNLYKSDITELQIPITYNKILKHFRLVDTPGINQTLLGDTKNRIDEYYSRANGVLWLLDATSIAAGANVNVLNEIQDSLNKVGGKTDNIIGVLNKIDEIEDKYGKDKVNDVLQDAKEIYGKYFTNIVPVSAKKAYDGVIENNMNLIKESNVDELIKSIQIKFQQKSQRENLTSVHNNLNLILKECSELVITYKNELINKEQERIHKKNLVNEEINKQKSKVKNDISKIVNDYTKSARERVSTYAQEIMDIESEEEKKRYVESKIIKVDELFDKLITYEKELKWNYKKIYNDLFEKSYFKEFEHIKINDLVCLSQKNMNLNEVGQSDYSFDLEGVSIVSSIGISAISTLFLGPIGIALGIFAQSSGLGKMISKHLYLPKLKTNLNNEIYNVSSKLNFQMIELAFNKMNEIQSKCDTAREKTFQELYCNSNLVNENIETLREIHENLNKKVENITIEEIILDTVVV